MRLRERRNRLYKTGYATFDNELAFFVSWMDSQPYIRAILGEIECAEIDFEEWRSTSVSFRGVSFPDTEAKRAKVCLGMCRSDSRPRFSAARNLDDLNRDFVETIVDPLVDYIEDRIEEGSAVLGLLLRYKRLVEWFDRARLFALATEDTRRGEQELDDDLRRFLLDRGIDFPFSQPESPTGKVDVVSGLDSPDPLSLEIKLFRPEANKDKAYVRQGFGQAYAYAGDYGLPAGYLAVFNLAPEPLVFDVPDSGSGVPWLRIGDRTVFLIAIETNPDTPSASRRKKIERHVISAKYLLAGIKD